MVKLYLALVFLLFISCELTFDNGGQLELLVNVQSYETTYVHWTINNYYYQPVITPYESIKFKINNSDTLIIWLVSKDFAWMRVWQDSVLVYNLASYNHNLKLPMRQYEQFN